MVSTFLWGSTLKTVGKQALQRSGRCIPPSKTRPARITVPQWFYLRYSVDYCFRNLGFKPGVYSFPCLPSGTMSVGRPTALQFNNHVKWCLHLEIFTPSETVLCITLAILPGSTTPYSPSWGISILYKYKQELWFGHLTPLVVHGSCYILQLRIFIFRPRPFLDAWI